MPGDIDRDRLVSLGLDYLHEAELLETAAALPAVGAPE